MELNEELGLEWYDFNARNYDPALGRWMNIDPLADSYHSWSPYNFVYNSPLKFIDPTGMGPQWIRSEGKDGSVTYEAEAGDSALSLYEQYGEQDGFSAEEAIDIVEAGVGRDNYTRESDGMLMSNVEEGDSFSIFTGEVIENDVCRKYASSP